MDPNQNQVGTIRPLGEHPRQVLKKSEEWSWRRCDNRIVAVLSKRKIGISKMATWLAAILANGPKRFLGRHILGFRGIYMKSFDKMPSLVTEEIQLREKSKMADGGHILWQTGTKFRPDHKGNIIDRFLKI